MELEDPGTQKKTERKKKDAEQATVDSYPWQYYGYPYNPSDYAPGLCPVSD